MCAVDYMLIRQIAVIYSTPGRNPISSAAYTLVDPPPSFRPIRCLYVGLIKPNSAHCIIICVLPICLSCHLLIAFNIELLPRFSKHHSGDRFWDYNSIFVPHSKRSFFAWRSCREFHSSCFIVNSLLTVKDPSEHKTSMSEWMPNEWLRPSNNLIKSPEA